MNVNGDLKRKRQDQITLPLILFKCLKVSVEFYPDTKGNNRFYLGQRLTPLNCGMIIIRSSFEGWVIEPDVNPFSLLESMI